MIELSCIFGFLNLYFKPVLLIISGCFAIYFAIQKFGNKVTAQYTFSMGLYTSDRISSVVLANKKDKTISVWSIHAVFDKEYQLELDKFDPPIVIKPYESTSFTLPEYSSATIGSDEFQLDYLDRNIELYIDIGHKLIKCSKQFKSDYLQIFTHISKHNLTFNGHIYNDRVSYILSYYYDDKLHTAFICGGMVTNEWEFRPNHLGNKEVTANQLENFLINEGFDSVFTNYQCYKVNFPRTELVFRKKAPSA